MAISNNYQRAIYNILGNKTIAYNAALARALGSVKAGILMGQMLYWSGKGFNKQWFYKTTAELYEETYLTGKEQSSAIRKCKEKGVLEVRLAGIPAKRHFKVNMEMLINLLSRLDKKAKLDSPLIADYIVKKVETNTYSTPENTTDTKDIKKQILKLGNKMNINNKL